MLFVQCDVVQVTWNICPPWNRTYAVELWASEPSFRENRIKLRDSNVIFGASVARPRGLGDFIGASTIQTHVIILFLIRDRHVQQPNQSRHSTRESSDERGEAVCREYLHGSSGDGEILVLKRGVHPFDVLYTNSDVHDHARGTQGTVYTLPVTRPRSSVLVCNKQTRQITLNALPEDL